MEADRTKQPLAAGCLDTVALVPALDCGRSRIRAGGLSRKSRTSCLTTSMRADVLKRHDAYIVLRDTICRLSCELSQELFRTQLVRGVRHLNDLRRRLCVWQRQSKRYRHTCI